MRLRTAVAFVVTAFAALLFGAVPVSAHVAIRLDIRSLQPGEQVRPDVDVRVFAQPMLGGVDRVSFVADLDGHPIDPGTGRIATAPTPAVLLANTQTVISLRGLGGGSHRLNLTYRPDTDEPAVTVSVEFVVIDPAGRATASSRSDLASWATVAAFAVAVLAVGGWLIVRRNGARRHSAPDST